MADVLKEQRPAGETGASVAEVTRALVGLRRSLVANAPIGSGLVVTGVVLGWCAVAASMIWAWVPFGDPAHVIDLHATLALGWLAGWIMGPIAFRGGGHGLRPEHFALLPIRPRRLAAGLLGASVVTTSVVITAAAFAALVVSATRLGPGAVVVAIPGVVLQLAVVVLISRVCVSALTVLLTSRRGQDLGGLIMALTIALASGGWSVIAVMAGHVADGPPPALGVALRALPTGWASVATVAAGRGDWAAAVGTLVGLAAVASVLLAAWAALLRRIMRRPEGRAPRTAASARRASRSRASNRGLLPSSPTGATLRKELRAWSRDPSRNLGLVLAVMLSALHVALPAVAFRAAAAEDGVETLVALPWAGVTAVVFACMAAVNVYGNDGSALWLLRMVPGTERADVRGRQAAWLVVTGTVLVPVTVALTVASGQGWAWPWILATLPAMLGVTAGLMMVFSVTKPIQQKDPHLRSGPFDTGDDSNAAGDTFGQGWVMALAAIVAAVPGCVLVYLGAQRVGPGLGTAGIIVSVLIGFVVYVWGGQHASRRLAARGDELMDLLSGRANQHPVLHEEEKLAPGAQAASGVLWTLAMVSAIPQGLVPLAMNLFDVDPDVRVWFVARYLPDAFQVPTAVAFVVIGVLAARWAVVIARRATSGNDAQA